MNIRLTWLNRTGPVHDPSSEDVLRVEYAEDLRNALARWPFAETVQVEGGAEHVLGFGRWLRGSRNRMNASQQIFSVRDERAEIEAVSTISENEFDRMCAL